MNLKNRNYLFLFIYSYFSWELDKDFTHEINNLRLNTRPGRYDFVNVGIIMLIKIIKYSIYFNVFGIQQLSHSILVV